MESGGYQHQWIVVEIDKSTYVKIILNENKLTMLNFIQDSEEDKKMDNEEPNVVGEKIEFAKRRLWTLLTGHGCKWEIRRGKDWAGTVCPQQKGRSQKVWQKRR